MVADIRLREGQRETRISFKIKGGTNPKVWLNRHDGFDYNDFKTMFRQDVGDFGLRVTSAFNVWIRMTFIYYAVSCRTEDAYAG